MLKKISRVLIFCLLSIGLLFQSNYNVKSTSYLIDTTDYFTLTITIITVLESQNLSRYDLHKFYLILDEIYKSPNDYLTTDKIQSLLDKHKIVYTSTRTNDRYELTNIELDYVYFDSTFESKKIIINARGVDLYHYVAGWQYYFDPPTCPIGFYQVYDDPIYFTNTNSSFDIDGVVLPPGDGKLTCVAIHTHNSLVSNGKYKNIITPTFERYLNEDQSLYGYWYQYNSIMNYYFIQDMSLLGVGFALNVKFEIIDNDKLIITNNNNMEVLLKIDRNNHYKRNNIQLNIFPSHISMQHPINDLYNKIGMSCIIPTIYDLGWLTNLVAYFHQIGDYNGDTSNYSITKFTCRLSNNISSYEAIYDSNGDLVLNPIIMGTYNFYDSNINSQMHFIYDVFPYYLWGNNELDTTTIIERFIWAKDSEPSKASNDFISLDFSLRRFRGETLINHGISEHLITNNEIVLLNLIKERIG